MRWIKIIAIMFIALSLCIPAYGERPEFDELMLEEQDGYEISFGPLIEAYQGQENVLAPIRLINEESVEYIHLSLEYDASIIEPTMVSPAMFFQYFRYDISIQGRIEIEVECNLIPPPNIPPIPAGDTAFAYILWDVIVENLDRDVYVPLEFYEDPNTPFPDNFIMRDNGYFVVPPQLMLTPGTIYVFRPIYGDINLNSLPYEIGDMITFISYLNGQIEFVPRQRANSDCNRDGIPATISDLVYMLNVINGEPDTLLHGGPHPIEPQALADFVDLYRPKPLKILDNNYIVDIFIVIEEPLGGFVIELKTPDFVSRVGEVALVGNDTDEILLISNLLDESLIIVGCSFNGALSTAGGVHLQVPIKSDYSIDVSDFQIGKTDFSSINGTIIDAESELQLENVSYNSGIETENDLQTEILAFPNPFNSHVQISFSLPQPDDVSLEIYDILGRKVRSLKNGHEDAGQQLIIWDGRNAQGDRVTTGIYFCRLGHGGEEQIVKLHYLK